MENSEKKTESWADDAIRQTPVDISKASKAAKIKDAVDWQDARAKMESDASRVQESVEDDASSEQESVEGACACAGDTPNPPDDPNNPKGNPKLLYIAAGVVLGAAAAPLAMPTVLGAIGFSGIGPVAGSIAAGLQSAGWAGGVGTVFSTVQSAAMSGYGVSAVTGAFTGIGAAVGGAAGAAAAKGKKGKQ